MAINLSFTDETYTSSNKPSTTTLKSDLSAIETAVNSLDSTSFNVDGTTAMTGNLNMGNNKISLLATPTASTDAVNKAYVDSGTVTMTNKTLTDPVINGVVSGTAILDEDDMASNSATKLATQQSIKAYVDGRSPATWSTWTPTWTNLTVGNGTVVAKYYKSGDIVKAFVSVTLGTTSSITGVVECTFPVAAASYLAGNFSIGRAISTDASVAYYTGEALLTASGRIRFGCSVSSATYLTHGDVTATTPFTFSSGDSISASVCYEAA